MKNSIKEIRKLLLNEEELMRNDLVAVIDTIVEIIIVNTTDADDNFLDEKDKIAVDLLCATMNMLENR